MAAVWPDTAINFPTPSRLLEDLTKAPFAASAKGYSLSKVDTILERLYSFGIDEARHTHFSDIPQINSGLSDIDARFAQLEIKTDISTGGPNDASGWRVRQATPQDRVRFSGRAGECTKIHLSRLT